MSEHHAALLAALGGLPADYLVIDVETNGLKLDDDLVLPVELGYAVVEGRRAAECNSVLVDWGRALPGPLARGFYERLQATADRMAGRGIACQTPVGLVRRDGLDPRDAWPAYLDLVAGAVAAGAAIVGHNLAFFDCPLLERVAPQMDGELRFDFGRVLDLGLLERAVVAGLPPFDPALGDRHGWYHHLKYAKAFARGKWSLDHCAAKYGLAVDPARAHGADADCYATHLLAEAYRALAEDPCPSASSSAS